jgi:hypothetical protein
MSPKLPRLDEFNDAVQNPHVAFFEASLKKGKVTTNGLGLPEPRTGGFAITYQLQAGGRNYAVRVFHKHTPDLEQRYRPISATLKGLKSDLFVDFEYQPKGILVNGTVQPIVKMDWISGETLGGYLEANYADRSVVRNLRTEMQRAIGFLGTQGIAHGDLQTGNILVAAGRVKLIDYDGMFVPGMAAKDASELGHRHFQHPQRAAQHFDARIDRFSQILLDLSLEAIATEPKLFERFATTGENILFSANDFQSPSASPVFQQLKTNATLRPKAERFAALCRTRFEQIPSFDDFTSGKWSPSVHLTTGTRQAGVGVKYQGAFSVLEGTDFAGVMRQVGNRIELIGQIVDVKEGRTKYRHRPYVFINFGPWQGSIAKVTIWDSGLAKLKERPSADWKGRWISVTGMVDAPYVSARYHYTHVGIAVSEANQLRLITAEEAAFRLGAVRNAAAVPPSQPVTTPPVRPITVVPAKPAPVSSAKRYQQVPPFSKPSISNVPQSAPAVVTTPRTPARTPAPTPPPSLSNVPRTPPPKSTGSCFVATACYGSQTHPNLTVLRRFRDEHLLTCLLGQWFVGGYYRVGPHLAAIIRENPTLKLRMTRVVDWIVERIESS